jgi:hypothetical protein
MLNSYEQSLVDNLYDSEKYIEELEARLEKARDVIDWALTCWDDHNEHGYNMQGDWVQDARAIMKEKSYE